ADVRMVNQAGLRENGFRAGQDLGEPRRARVEDEGMPPFDDPQIGFPTRLFDAAEDAGAEPLGMQPAVINLERQVGDPRSPEPPSHSQFPFPAEGTRASERTGDCFGKRPGATRTRYIIRLVSIERNPSRSQVGILPHAVDTMSPVPAKSLSPNKIPA